MDNKATIWIENTYAECGRQSQEVVSVRAPVPGESLDDWWQEVVHPHTGDGHPCGRTDHALYTAEILRIDDPVLRAGDKMEWEG